MTNDLQIVSASKGDIPVILRLIKELADFENLSDDVVASEEDIHSALFSDRPTAEALVGHCKGEVVGFALFFHNFSTFLGRRGIYLEDLYVRPAYRGQGFGRRFLIHVAGLAKERRCGRIEWSVLNWNKRAIKSYGRAGAVAMDEWTVYRLAGDALDRLAAEAGDVRRQ